jgi:putrescine carbamoyltransferase
MPLTHFLDTQAFTPRTIRRMLRLAVLLKDADRARACPELLRGASLGMIFEEPSTRTRVSFEVAMTRLGGHALYLKPGEIHLGVRESLADTARVLSRMCDAVELRALHHETLLELASYATVPVINGLTDYNHPTQALCDLLTMTESKRPDVDISDLTVVFVGDATNVCTSLANLLTRMGATFVHARPDQYGLKAQWPQVIDECAANHAAYRGTLIETDEVESAVATADFVYTDLWWWLGQEAEIPDRQRAFMPRYQLNNTLLARAPAHARVMHCLPASRGVEVTDDVLDGPQSIVFDQAENRLHMEKALLTWFIYPRLHRPTTSERVEHAARIHGFLQDL